MAKKSLTQLILGIQGHLRSFKVIDIDSLMKLVTGAYYDKRHVCAYL